MSIDAQHTPASVPPVAGAADIDALCEGAEQLHLLLAEQHMLVYFVDRQLIVRAVAGHKFPGSLAEESVNRSLYEVAPHLEVHALQLREMLAGHLAWLDLGIARRSDSASEPYLWSQLSARCEGERVIGLVYTLQEASGIGDRLERLERQRREIYDLRQQQVRLNLEIAEAQAEVRRLDELKSQFVSAAAHELRNPLASLMGYIELLDLEAAANLSETQRQYVAGLMRSAQRLGVLSKNLLDISRLDSNRLELVLTCADPILLIEDAVGEVQPLFELKRQRVILRAEPSIPQIWCDRERAMQILTNLLSNAQKYTPPGGSVTVSVARVKNRPYVVMRVKDTGIGIPPEEQFQLFNRFYRASNAGAADGSGAGLGLAITQSLVKLHGGKIWFESKLGKGSTFHVTFPAAS